jgi:N-acetylglucosaminyldiphosphoundecaprenol N-acetyl-beta-D-mannosaminyltransferase
VKADQPPTYPVCGVSIAALTPIDAARHVVARSVSGTGTQAHLCNAYTLSLVDSNPALRQALDLADLNLPDGAPVAWLGRRHGALGPVRGPQLVDDVARLGVAEGLRHFFWGGAVGVALRAADRLEARHAGMKTVGTSSPPFRDFTNEEYDQAAQLIADSGAQIVWVGLGTPKQDVAVPELAQRLPDLVIVPVGAAFDFWAGSMSMAPKWIHGSGLEWIYRLCQEPRRLWRRYLLGNPRFAWKALKYRGNPRSGHP